jgi:hypothetical protein
MTPKEKAGVLVIKFIKHSRAERDIKPIQSAKDCALIAVDEIIMALEDYGKSTFELQNMEQDFRHWEKVKEEIQKL